MCTRYPIINRVSELKVHIELTRFVQPEKIEIDANERAVNEKSQYCFFVCTTFDSFLNDLQGTIPCPLHHNYYVFASTNLKLLITVSEQRSVLRRPFHRFLRNRKSDTSDGQLHYRVHMIANSIPLLHKA